MERWEIDMHLMAGRAYGEEATCGGTGKKRKKVDYGSEISADKAAKVLMTKGSKDLEAYPCAFCHGWHIGRKMTDEERYAFSVDD